MKALVAIDLQKIWTDPDSPYHVHRIPTDQMDAVLKHARGLGYKIIFTKHVEPEEGFDDEGGCFLDGIDTSSSTVVTKGRICPFYKTGMDIALEGIEEVVVFGILTNLCVRSFIEGAYDRDLDITVIHDCCAAFDKDTHAFTLKDLKATREEIKVISADDFLRT